MKVCFSFIKAGMSIDIWFYNLAKSLKSLGVDAEIIIYPHKYQFFPDLLGVFKRDIKADIIHANSWNGFVFKENIPLVVTAHHLVHEQALNKYKSLPQKVFHKLIYRFENKSFTASNQITCVSDYTKSKLQEIFGFDSTRIYNGIDVRNFSPQRSKNVFPAVGKDKTTLLFVGNMTRRKGADLLPKIMKRLGDRFVLICISGSGKNMRKAGDNIYMINHLSQQRMIEYYNYCDMFLFPTRLEGFGLVVAEAMACAKPVVTTNCSSMPELIIDGKGGFLCEMDNVNEFTEKIQALAENKALRKEMGRFNRERVEKYFSLERMAKDYYALYQKIIKG